ncbi:fumarate hydratase C-terminal domain-containing protein [Myxococcota bacterium]|nr:fumarate hydratase C-terminal domain-containing protein [Myxococcota bacterium]
MASPSQQAETEGTRNDTLETPTEDQLPAIPSATAHVNAKTEDMTPLRLELPFQDHVLAGLRAGHWVWLEGTMYSMGHLAGQRLVSEIKQGLPTAIPLEQQSIYFSTPSPAPFGKVIGSFDPEISAPFNRVAIHLLAAGVRCVVGYGPRNHDVIEAIKRGHGLYLHAPGGAGALLARCVLQSEIVAYPDLGLEAIRRIKVSLFPALIAVDAFGRDIFHAYHTSQKHQRASTGEIIL